MNEDSAASAPLDFERAELSPEAAAMSCAACKSPIERSYYAVNGRFVCPSCQQGLVVAQRTGGSFPVALLLGTGGALVGAGLYYGVAALTGYEVGLVAIVVGVLVGKAVRKGAGMRPGNAYRVLALVLTYLAIAGAAVPRLLALDGVESLTHAITLALMMPALMLRSVSGALGLLILGIGLYEGWKHSAAPVLDVQGPFERDSAVLALAPEPVAV